LQEQPRWYFTVAFFTNQKHQLELVTGKTIPKQKSMFSKMKNRIDLQMSNWVWFCCLSLPV